MQRRRMRPLDRALCINAGILGLIAFAVAVSKADAAPWLVPVGVAALLVGLVTASLAAWRGRW